MHFEPARACYGFEQMTLPLDYMRQYDRKAETARPKAHGIGECEMEPVISTVEVKDSITTWIVDQSIDFLETRDTTRPFSSGPASPSPILPLIPAGTSGAFMKIFPCPSLFTAAGPRPCRDAPGLPGRRL